MRLVLLTLSLLSFNFFLFPFGGLEVFCSDGDGTPPLTTVSGLFYKRFRLKSSDFLCWFELVFSLKWARWIGLAIGNLILPCLLHVLIIKTHLKLFFHFPLLSIQYCFLFFTFLNLFLLRIIFLFFEFFFLFHTKLYRDY